MNTLTALLGPAIAFWFDYASWQGPYGFMKYLAGKWESTLSYEKGGWSVVYINKIKTGGECPHHPVAVPCTNILQAHHSNAPCFSLEHARSPDNVPTDDARKTGTV